MKKILTVVGARPQFIKAAPVCRVLRQSFTEILVHTGQHYDANMSEVFFHQMGIPEPDVNLGIGSGLHGEQTGNMLSTIEKILLDEKPDAVLVYGDTNSTLAGALAAAKLQLPVAHIEAGLRSYNRTMPEEINRVMTDHCADHCYCPTQTAVDNLKKEGITRGVFLTGDVMYDAALHFSKIADKQSDILDRLDLALRSYVLGTIHRPANTDDKSALEQIVNGLVRSGLTVVFPVHPRTRKALGEFNLLGLLEQSPQIRLIDPVGYLDMIRLEKNAQKIITDSGGIQKEAYFYRVPCITVRPQTEWVETVQEGWNVLVPPEESIIAETLRSFNPDSPIHHLFGDGHASEKIVRDLQKLF